MIIKYNYNNEHNDDFKWALILPNSIDLQQLVNTTTGFRSWKIAIKVYKESQTSGLNKNSNSDENNVRIEPEWDYLCFQSFAR